MRDATIRFDDGATYEQTVGAWSRLVGADFLDWLEPVPGSRWLDVGCGTGSFTELLVERCAPIEVHGIDPAEPQLTYARTRPAGRIALFRKGDAMALPYGRHRFDSAVMALVIFFVPDPARCVAEMVRVVRPGGTVAAYAWDIAGGGSAVEPVMVELQAIGIAPPRPPKYLAAGIEALEQMWAGCGLEDTETRQFTVQRTFADFAAYWAFASMANTVAAALRTLPDSEIDLLKLRVHARLPTDAAGRIVQTARANAVKGRRPQ
jgi:SAM-dependent methyltransferase